MHFIWHINSNKNKDSYFFFFFLSEWGKKGDIRENKDSYFVLLGCNLMNKIRWKGEKKIKYGVNWPQKVAENGGLSRVTEKIKKNTNTNTNGKTTIFSFPYSFNPLKHKFSLTRSITTTFCGKCFLACTYLVKMIKRDKAGMRFQ